MEGHVGLVQLKDLKRRRVEEKERQEKESILKEIGGGQEEGDDEKKSSHQLQQVADQSNNKPSRPTASKKKKNLLSIPQEDEDDEQGDDDTSARLRGKKLKPLRDTTIDSSFIKTKKEELKENRLKEQIRQEFVEAQSRIKQEEIEIPFVYFDGAGVPGEDITVKKGDPIWVFLDKTRKGKKEFHRGTTVDDILFVKDNIIIPHNYDIYYFMVNPVETKKGPLFNFDNLQSEVCISRTC